MPADRRRSAELDKLRSDFERVADELERLQKLKAEYVSAIAKFKSDDDDLAARPGCLGALFSGSGARSGRAAPTFARTAELHMDQSGSGSAHAAPRAAEPQPRAAEVKTEDSRVAEIRSRLAKLEGTEGIGTDDLREAYAEAIRHLEAEKERLIS